MKEKSNKNESILKLIDSIKNEDLRVLVGDLISANSHAGFSLLTEDQKDRIKRLNQLVETGEAYLYWRELWSMKSKRSQ